MIEIKELPYDIIKVKDNEYEALKLTEKEIQQILQDIEDAKKFNDINYISESHKECANNAADFAEELGKYRQIVKRLKAKLKECKENAGGMEFGLVLEKILEGKK